MDSLQIVVVASPFANMSSLYEVDPDADLLLIVPPFNNASFAALDEDDDGDGYNKLHINGTTAANNITPGLRLKVSSKHLSLASQPFKNKLQSARKAITPQSDGRTHISILPTGSGGLFDPKAVTIVMNAVHGRGFSKVPRRLDDGTGGGLERLAKIAYLVDRFQLFDALEVYADRWIDSLWSDDEPLEDASERDLVFWVYVGHVFRRADIFKNATRAAAATAAGPMRSFGLPIREKIIKHIDLQRQELVGKTLGVLNDTLEDLRDGNAVCDKHHCDSFLLGDLIKTLHRSGQQIWPQPSKPFTGASFAGIVRSVHQSGLNLDRLLQGGYYSSSVTELWSGRTNSSPNRKRKSPVQVPLTPDSSPEPVSRTNGRKFDVHECEVWRLFVRLEDIELLKDDVAGLDLESSLGYQLY